MKRIPFFGIGPAVVSLCAGIALSLIGNLQRGDPWQSSMLIGAAVGLVVGFFASAAFTVSILFVSRKPVFAFASLALVIAVCAGGSSLLFTDLNLPLSAGIAILSEIAGLASAFIFWRRGIAMNRRLEETKKYFASRI